MHTSAMRIIIAALLLTVLQIAPARAQAPPTAAPDQSQQLLKPEELDQLVAPIALHPDALLAEILMASTYPLEVVQADRWATANKSLKGDQLKAEVDKQSWDDSVKSLVPTPSVLAMMSSQLEWTQKLGDAVLAQQPDVMDAIQRLRSKAQANNKLTSTKEQTVSVTQQQNKQVIVIEPAVPDTVYVPYYDPAVVYGEWPYSAYQPYYFPPPLGYVPGAMLATGLAFGAGYAVGRWASGGNYWGGGCNWGGGNINVNRPVNINNIGSGNTWQHNPTHRQGVQYSNKNVQQKFGNNNVRAGSQDRADFRGRSGDQVLKPGSGGAGDRGAGNVGDRGGGVDRTSGNRGDAGNRPSQGAKGGPSQGAKGPSQGAKKSPSQGANRPSGGGGRDSAMGNISSGKVASAQSARGQASLGGGGGGARAGGGGGARMSAGGGGGGARMGGGGGGGRGGGGGGGGRRSDIRLKHDVTLLGRFDNGLGFYRFSYNGSDKAYVGVIAQEVQTVMPGAVTRGRDGYLRVFYDKLGLKFDTYDHWFASGAQVRSAAPILH